MEKPLLLLIHPAALKDSCRSTRRRKSSVAQLNLLVIAAYARKYFEVRIIDENIEDIDEEVPADLVGITIMTSTALRGYEIAELFRKRGIPVVMGGVHVFFLPDEAARYADSLVIGESEGIIEGLFTDFFNGGLKKKYRAEQLHNLDGLPAPPLDLLKEGQYSFSNIMETARGCPHDCEYCSVSQFWGRKFRLCPVEEVIEGIKSMPPGDILFIDDNMFGHPARAKELFEKMIPLKRRWYGQGDIRVAHNTELLDLAARSGCKWIFVGFESTNPDNLKAMKKEKINIVEQYAESISLVHQKGINIFGSFMFGLDNDDESVFDRTLSFCMDNRLGGANFYIVTPFPGTRLFKKMEEDGRILHKDWSRYDANHVVFKPALMTESQLMEGYITAYKRFYSLPSIAKRLSGKRKDFFEILALNLGRFMNRKYFEEGCRI